VAGLIDENFGNTGVAYNGMRPMDEGTTWPVAPAPGSPTFFAAGIFAAL